MLLTWCIGWLTPSFWQQNMGLDNMFNKQEFLIKRMINNPLIKLWLLA